MTITAASVVLAGGIEALELVGDKLGLEERLEQGQVLSLALLHLLPGGFCEVATGGITMASQEKREAKGAHGVRRPSIARS